MGKAGDYSEWTMRARRRRLPREIMSGLGIDERLERLARTLRARLDLSRRTFAIAVVAYLAFIWLLSSSHPPGSELVRSSALKYAIEMAYNLAHVPIFAGLAFVWILAIGTGRDGFRAGRGVLAAAFVLTLAYGVVDEFHQSFTPGRTASPFDVTNDGIAAVIAITFTSRIYAPSMTRRSRRAVVEIAGLVLAAAIVAHVDIQWRESLDAWWREWFR